MAALTETRFKGFVPQGVIPAVLLPFHDDLSIDEPSFRSHLRDIAAVEGLSAVTINAPVSTLVANVTARPVADKSEIAGLLVQQVTGRVRWRESVLWLAAEGGVTTFAELGGKVLTGMSKRIAPEANSLALTGAADFEAFAASLKA